MNNVESKLKNVVNWVINNPNTDPNCYEMSDIFIDISNLKSGLTKESEENLKDLGEKRLRDLEEKVNVKKEHNLYKLMNKLYNHAKEGKSVVQDSIAKEYICKCSSVSLYIEQQKRDEPDYVFDNANEFEQMKISKEYCEKNNIELPEECEKLMKNIEVIIKR